MPEIDAREWEDYLLEFPEAHILQTCQWGELKSRYGWEAARVLTDSSPKLTENLGAQILFRSVALGYSIGYIPKGPVIKENWQEKSSTWQAFWREVDQACRKRKAVFLKVEPDVFEHEVDEGVSTSTRVAPAGFKESEQSIQPARTLIIDISGEESRILGQMKQKTRYNVRLAQRKGVVVSTSSDIAVFHNMLQETGQRDKFPVHSRSYYQSAYDLFQPLEKCELLQAEYAGQPIACLMVFAHGQRSWYFYGGAADVHRDMMPAYLLQWEAIRWARNHGCLSYDMWGVPDHDADYLESQFTTRSGGLWGVYRFKRGFGGQLRRALGPWDRIYHPALYAFYRWWLRIRSSRSEYGG